MSKINFKKVPYVDLINPKDGYVVYLDYWWVVTPDSEVLFYTARGAYSPQCNKNERIVQMLCKNKHYDGCRPVYVPVAYVKPPKGYEL